VRRLQLEKKAPDAVRPDGARVTGIAVAGHEPVVFAKNQDNTVAALQKRSAVKPAPFHPADREEFCTWFLKHWPGLVAQWMKLHVPSDPDEWLEHVLAWIAECGSDKHVKERYETTARALHAQGITSWTTLTPTQVYEWTKREASVKLETVLKRADKSPRQILAATSEFVVMTAPFVKMLTGLVRRKWKPNCKLVYAPGVGSKRLADAMTEDHWDNMANVDFDGYDSSQGIQIGQMEREICKRHGAPVAMLQLMEGNFETHGASREGVKFNTPYVRNSGDPWTTLFNTTLNAGLMMFVYCRLHECDPRDARVRFFAGGDDGALFYNGPRINFTHELARLGLPATVCHVDQLHHVEFLSCRLTHTTTGWNFIPMVGKVIAKLGYSVRATTPHKAKQIARGAAMSMYSCSSGCPPLRAYLDAVLRVTEGAAPATPRDEPWKMNHQHTGEATATTWAHLYDIYGWSTSLQDTLVARLATVKEAGTVIDSPALDVLCDRDTARGDFLFGRLPDHDLDGGWVKDLTTEGVEPNPGPTIIVDRSGVARPARRARQVRNRRRRRNATAVVVRRPRSQRGAVVVAGPVRRRNRVRGGIGGRMGLPMAGDARAYACCLNDPFNCPPVRLGAGCKIPTGLATLFTTFNYTTTVANTSFQIWPRPFDPILVSTTQTPGGPYVYTLGPTFPQQAQLATIANGVRVVAAGLKITSTASAANDNGLVVSGLLPRDNFSPNALNPSGPSITQNTTTENGLAMFPTSTALLGFNEFLNLDQTESFAARKGATIWYRPEDPLDFTFKSLGFLKAISIQDEDIQIATPSFAVGLVGAAVGSTFLFELVLHVEYTTGPFVPSIMNAGMGNLTADGLQSIASAIFKTATNTAREGINAAFQGGMQNVAGTAARAAGNIINRVANYYSSTDNAGAMVPYAGGRAYNMMEVD
jgi:hypothetical protein